MPKKYRLAELIATFFYVGKIKWAPGTMGSLAAFPLYYMLINFIFSSLSVIGANLLYLFACLITFNFLLFLVGMYSTSIYINHTEEKDPKEVVIDEVVGQILTLILCLPSVAIVSYSKLPEYFGDSVINFVFLFLLPFSLFRLFDILKPWPINYLDQHIKGAMGVMLDDVVAGIFAAVMQYVVIFLVVDFFAS